MITSRSSSSSFSLTNHINDSSSCSNSKSSLIFRNTNIMHAPSINTRNTICCCSRNNSHGYIPKLQPFSTRTKFDRALQDPPLIQKSENELAGLLFLCHVILYCLFYFIVTAAEPGF